MGGRGPDGGLLRKAGAGEVKNRMMDLPSFWWKARFCEATYQRANGP